MNLRKLISMLAVAVLLLGAMAGTGLAKGGGKSGGKGNSKKISKKFEDMTGFEWGLNHVVKMQIKGIFKGRGESQFAPGAKITRQEAAVATVRLIGKEAEAQASAKAEVDTLLKDIPDRSQIATWARPAVALLVKLGAADSSAAYAPSKDASRLDLAVLLVKAMGLSAEAEAKSGASLPFKDANLIPAEAAGYVAVALEHGLINGYVEGNSRTFRPNQAVKRIEMAVMMGRAEGKVKRERHDELKGLVTGVSADSSTLTINVKGNDVTVSVSDEAAIFVDDAEKNLADVAAGMKVELKLDSEGIAIYIEAKTVEPEDEDQDENQDGDQDDNEQEPENITVTGTIVSLTASLTGAAKISLGSASGGVTTVAEYDLNSNAEITVSGQAGQFADLRLGDSAQLTLVANLVTKVEVTRN